MSLKNRYCLFLLLLALPFSQRSYGQSNPADSILLGGIVVNGDTLPMVFLEDYVLKAGLARKWAKKQAEHNRLRGNIHKVYPYAVIAAELLKDVDSNLALIPTKKARKEYMKGIERELNRRFKGELQDFSITQGQILVKLINRQTGKNCFSIIKEVKGGFSAVVWQSLALIFNNSLKREYDPKGDDKDMEAIVQELEASNYYRYYYYQQLQNKNRLQTRRN